MRNITFITGLVLLLLGCEKATETDYKNIPPDVIVVDGIITNEQKAQMVRLTHPVVNPNDTPLPVAGAVVMIYDADSVWNLSESPTNPGYYYSPVWFLPVVGRTYTLLINTDDKSLTAKAVMTKPFAFFKARYAKGNNDLYHILPASNPYNPNRAAMYKVNLDWSFLPSYREQNPEDCKAVVFYYTLPTLDVNEILAPTSETVWFPAGTHVVETRYSLSDEHAAFIRAMLLNTTWNGGLFDGDQASLPTNLNDGGVGFFGACGVATRTFFVLPEKKAENLEKSY